MEFGLNRLEKEHTEGVGAHNAIGRRIVPWSGDRQLNLIFQKGDAGSESTFLKKITNSY